MTLPCDSLFPTDFVAVRQGYTPPVRGGVLPPLVAHSVTEAPRHNATQCDTIKQGLSHAARSTLRETRNPILALPAAKALMELSPSTRAALRGLLLEIQADARLRADKCWKTHKAPMAVYWKAVGVYAGHIARALNSTSTNHHKGD